MQLILAPTSGTSTLDELASLADKILEVSPSPGQVAATSSRSSELSELKQVVADLTKQVQSLTTKVQQQERGRSRSRSRSNRSRSSSRTEEHTGEHCWYHWKYGTKAAKCRPPCTFTPKPSKEENDQASD